MNDLLTSLDKFKLNDLIFCQKKTESFIVFLTDNDTNIYQITGESIKLWEIFYENKNDLMSAFEKFKLNYKVTSDTDVEKFIFDLIEYNIMVKKNE